jgi:hypothetical protein
MVREGAGCQGAVEVVLQQVALRASPFQLGLVFWVALPERSNARQAVSALFSGFDAADCSKQKLDDAVVL